ncbi:MAG: alpha/beta hydrolase [Bacteroidota bacterium]
MSPNEWLASGDFFTFQNKHQIFYKRFSNPNKPALLFLHGFPTASWDWWKIWDDLGQHFDLYAFDFLGFGFSDKDRDHDYSLMEQTDIALAYLDHFGITEYHILAHDYGDSVGQELLARHLEKQTGLQSIVFLNGGLFPAFHHPRFIQKALIGPFGRYISKLVNKGTLDRNFKQVFGKKTQPSPQEIDDFYSLINHKEGKYIFYKLIRYMTERKEYGERWTNALMKSNVPMRLIDGCVDPVSGRHLAVHYDQVVPQADVIYLEEIGHYPQTESPELVLSHFYAFHQIS